MQTLKSSACKAFPPFMLGKRKWQMNFVNSQIGLIKGGLCHCSYYLVKSHGNRILDILSASLTIYLSYNINHHLKVY